MSAPEPPVDIVVRMVAPQREQCGVSDYSAHLVDALRPLVKHIDVVTPDETAAGEAATIAHVQHQYFLFGGVAPWKNRFHRYIRTLREPVVMTVHELVEPAGNPLRRAAIALTNRRNFAHPAVRSLIVHTDADRERLVRWGVRREKVALIRLAVPDPIPTPPREECRKRLDVDSRFVLLMPGFISRRKGHLLAIEAMRQLPPDCLLLIAGGRHPDDTTSYVDEVEHAVASAGLQERVRVTGFVSADDLAAYLAASDLVLAPSLEESGSASLALAFAHGCAIAASDIAPHREIVADTSGALRPFRAGSPTHLAGAVKELAAAPEKREELSRGARRYAEAHSFSSVARDTVAVYRSVLAGGPACG